MAIITRCWILDSIIILMIIIVAAYFFMTRKFNYWKKRGVMEIKPLPFVGNFGDCLLHKRSPAFIMMDFYNRAKGLPYIGLYVFDKPCLLILDRELIKHILVKDFNYFCDRHSSSGPQDLLGSSSIAFVKNPVWKVVRHKLSPIFTSAKLKKMFDLLLESAANLDSYFDKLDLDDEEKEIDARDICANITTDMICNTAFGLNIDSVNNPKCEFREMGRLMFEADTLRGFELFMIFFYPEISRFMTLKFFGKESTNFLRKAFWDTINHRLQSGQKRGDLIDILIDLKKEYQNLREFGFDGDGLVAHAAFFFAGGFETSSSAMCFALYEVAMQPQIQDRLRKEILDAINENEGKITYNMILSLPYLDMVVSETMRKYPIIAILDREAVKPYKVPNSDLVLEKGTPIFISLFGLHYDPEYFPNPEKYDPERFSEENKSKVPPFSCMPVGEGPRMCIGARLGRLQTKLGLIKFLSRYELTPNKNTLIPMVFNMKSPVTEPIDCKVYLNIRKLSTNVK